MATIRSLYVSLELKAQNYSNAIRDAQKETKEFEKSIKPLMDTAKQMGAGMMLMGTAMTAAVTLPIVGIAKLGLEFNTLSETAQIAFTTMLGSGQKATKFLSELQAFAAHTPFEFPGLVNASQRLMAMGFAAKDVLPMLTTVGDAMAGLGRGQEGIDRVTLALGQMQGRGKVATQEMNQLTEAAIPAWKILAEGIGVSEKQLRDMVEKGVVPADKAIKALLQGMDERFGGMMAKQSQTFTGLMSTIKDQVRLIAGELTGPLFSTARDVLGKLVVLLDGVTEKLKGMSDTTKSVIAGFGLFGAALGPITFAFGAFLYTLPQMIQGWNALTTAIKASEAATWALGVAQKAMPWALVIAGFVAVIALAKDYYDTIQNNKIAEDDRANSLLQAGKNTQANIKYLREHGVELDKETLRSMKHEEVQALLAKEMQKLFGIKEKSIPITKAVAVQDTVATEAAKKYHDEITRLKQAVTGNLEETKKFAVALSQLHAQKVPLLAITRAYGSQLEKEAEQAHALGKAMLPVIDVTYRLMVAHRALQALGGVDLIDTDVINRQREIYTENVKAMQAATMVFVMASVERIDELAQAWRIMAEQSADVYADWLELQTDIMQKSTKAEIERLEDQQKETHKAANEYGKVWSEAVGQVTHDLVRGLGDIIFAGKKWSDALVGIAKTAARSMFEAFLSGLIAPLTTRLAKLGSDLASTLGGKGGILGTIFGGGGKAAGAAGGATTAGGGAAGGAGGLFGLGGATLPVLGGAAIGIALLAKQFGKGRKTADEFVQNFQNPFGAMLGGITNKEDLATAWEDFNETSSAFASQGDIEAKVVRQAHATLDPLIAQLQKDLPSGQTVTNNFNITQQPNEDTGTLVNEIIRYLQSNSGAGAQFAEALPA